jgi:hypothetical protein
MGEAWVSGAELLLTRGPAVGEMRELDSIRDLHVSRVGLVFIIGQRMTDVLSNAFTVAKPK